MDPFDLGAEQRWTIFTTTVQAALHQPLLGFGWGTHPRAYHPFQPASLFGQIHHAHNEYVNVFFETGAVGLLLCLAAMSFWFLRVWRAQKPLPGPDRMPVTAALAAVSVTLLHSLVDFDLRITAVGIPWAALLGLGAAAVRDGEARPTWPVPLVALIAAAACWTVPLEGNLGLAPYDHKAAWNAGEVEVASDLWPAELNLQRAAGLTFWERGEKAKAAVCFKRLFETEPAAVDGVLDEVGVDGFEALLPDTPKSRAMYAGALAKRGRWEQAAEAFARGPVDAAGCDYFASTLESGGQWGLEAAVRERRLALRSDAWAHAASASAWLKLGALDRALERARTASRVDPTNARWAGLRAAILDAKGERTAAVEAWTEACALAPAELEWRLGRGFTELADKTYVAAAEDFKEVLKSRPDDRRATIALAQALEGQNLAASARILLDDWLRKHPDDGGVKALRDGLPR
jgi:tetratricopeptide (TPR) repeat protein